MHMYFTDEELEWIDTSKFGFPIIDGCPEEIRDSIEKKKEQLNSQKKGVLYGSQDNR